MSSRTKACLKCFAINLILGHIFNYLMPFHFGGMSVTHRLYIEAVERWCVFLTPVVGFIQELVLDNCR